MVLYWPSIALRMFPYSKFRLWLVRRLAQSSASTDKADGRNKKENQHGWTGESIESKAPKLLSPDSTKTSSTYSETEIFPDIYLFTADQAATHAQRDLRSQDFVIDELNILSKTSDWQLFQFFEGLELSYCEEPQLNHLLDMNKTLCDERLCQQGEKNQVLDVAADSLRCNTEYPSHLSHTPAVYLNYD